MAIQIQATYAKKLGLPNYSSHSFMVSVSAEVASLRKLETETKRVYALLQNTVDEQLQAVGFMPDATKYGMIVESAKPASGSIVKAPKALPPDPDSWGCSEKQRAFIEKVAGREEFTPGDLDGIAQRVCGAPVCELDKRQASRFIDELLKLSSPIPFRNGPKGRTQSQESGVRA